jgi:phosphatidylserine decarboxylase
MFIGADATAVIGGSTIVLLFEKDAIEWDEDLLINSRACLETLVRVGMGVGKSLRPAQPFPS